MSSITKRPICAVMAHYFGIGMSRRYLYLGAIGITVLHSFLSRADELIDSWHVRFWHKADIA